VPGTEIVVIVARRSATAEVSVRGALSLRRSEARRIHVAPR
jgi:Fe2+ transport system protein FeoA